MIVKAIVQKLKAHSAYLKPKESGVKVPFLKAIVNGIPSDNVWAMTVIDRTMRYLTLITKINMDSRPRIVDTRTGAFSPISTFEDLKEVLMLMERGGSNIRPYIADFYRKVFKPKYEKVFQELKGQPRADQMAKESYCGLTTKEIAEEYKEVYGGAKPSSHQLRDKYLYPLLNQGLVNSVSSALNLREHIWFPVDQDANIFSMFENSEDLRLKVTDVKVYPSMDVLEDSYSICSRQEEKSPYKIIDTDNTELTAQELNNKYFKHPDICFKQGWKAMKEHE